MFKLVDLSFSYLLITRLKRNCDDGKKVLIDGLLEKTPRNLNLLRLTQNQWLHYYEDWVKYYITNINAIRKKIRIGRAD